MKVAARTRRVAVLGNPNTGKSTLWNALTGLRQRVGNYPGVTVEKKTGRMGEGIELLDLPGTYSLAAFSPDEAVAARILLGDVAGEARPDLAVVVVDAANLERNLYLVTQAMETGLPVVVALNMVDLARRAGVEADAPGLARSLGVPVVPTVAPRKEGLDELRRAIETAIGGPAPSPGWIWPEEVEREADRIARRHDLPPFLARRALVDVEGSAEESLAAVRGEAIRGELEAARERVKDATGLTPGALEARMRYGFIGRAVAPHVTRRERGRSRTDRVDAILTHRLFGTVIFAAAMTIVFMSIFEWAGPLMDGIDAAFGALGDLVSGWFAGTALEGGLLQSLLVDGVIAGVGGVLIFLPQIAVLFLFIALLEDCGYLARAAFLMDRLLRFCGLSGSSFIPLLSSFACAIPGIMAARTIGDRRDRLTTILVAPLMSCSARIPVYTLLIAAFVPAGTVAGFLPQQGLTMAAMYFLGIAVAAVVALLLRRTLFRGPTRSFLMELPPYRMPSARTVGLRVLDRAKAFVVRAGTVIFAMSIVVWALGTFPRSSEVVAKHAGERAEAAAALAGAELESRLAEIDAAESGELLRGSALGVLGRGVEPAVEPLGWDWRIGVAAIASFPAREVVVSTLGILYGLGAEGADDESGMVATLRASRRPDGSPVYSLAVALSLMVFFAICCQCGATVATIRREANSWGWAGFAFGYMTVLAYVLALVTYQVASALGG